MVFSSVEFLFYFLPVFLIVYFVFAQKNIILLVFSLLFYSWGEGLFVLLMIASGFGNHVFARMIERGPARRNRWLLAIGLAANLLTLFLFKYLDFSIKSLNAILKTGLEAPQIHLPIGISFFTFHAISYLVDVYRGELPAERNPFNVLLYLSMFPQLVAGPIVRFGTVQKEVHKRDVTVQKMSIGLKFFVIGLGQKALIANTLAAPVDAIHGLPVEVLDAPLAWLSAVCYTLQIYFDFAGYSNMAIGLGLVLGLYFPLNFNYPYVSQSISEFWRRWHITLSTWFRDYLYIPLGGNRTGTLRTYLNLTLVFALCGLWHGANWNFVIWGLYHGVFLVVERWRLSKWLLRMGREVRHLYVVLVIIIGWVFFRAADLPTALAHLTAMVGLGSGDGIIHHIWQHLQADVGLALVAGAVGATPLVYSLTERVVRCLYRERLTDATQPFAGWIMVSVLYSIFILSIISIAAGSYNPFIYFRF